MASWQLIAVLCVVLFLATVDAETWWSRRRRNQYQRPLTSHFRQRASGLGRSPNNFLGSVGSPKEYQHRELSTTGVSPNERDGTSAAAPSYAASDSYSGSYGGSYSGGGYGGYETSHTTGGSVNPVSALVAPLAALTLLGAAVAVASNPVLLSLATISSGRKRRALNGEEDPELEKKLHEMEVLEDYIARSGVQDEQQAKLMASYLSCAGYTEASNSCLDRVVCEYSIEGGTMNELEKNVIAIVLYNVMSNNHVPKEYKQRLRQAAQHGRSRGQCRMFSCSQLTVKDYE